MDLRLKNNIVVISGATGAIGMEICRGFIEEGTIIVPLYRKEDKYHKMISELESQKISIAGIHPHQVDFNDSKALGEIIKGVISRHGKIDVLVNNVGKSLERPFLAMSEEEWEYDIDINLHITARLIRIVMKHMFIAGKGSIINISSLVSTRYGRGVTAYATAKAGIDRLTQTLAQEVGQKGIRINAVCPGIIKTDMSKPIINRIGDYILEETALGRFGKAEEVSKAVLFLASENTASFITGQTLIVDGGLGL